MTFEELREKLINLPKGVKASKISDEQITLFEMSDLENAIKDLNKKQKISKLAVQIRSEINRRILEKRNVYSESVKKALTHRGENRLEANLMPAAVFYPNHGGLGIYIKWKNQDKRYGNKVLSASSWHVHMELPDREILLVGTLNSSLADWSFNDWDEFVPLSLFHDSTNFSRGTTSKAIMINAHQNVKSKRNAATRRSGKLHSKTDKVIFSDSGGFQLKNRNTFVSPIEVAKFYNENADYGVVLDFPLLDPSDTENHLASAEIQRDNIQVMLDNLEPSKKLINVCHGVSTDERMNFLEIVHHKDIHSMAFPKRKALLSFIHDLIETLELMRLRYGEDHYTHIHILGVAQPKTVLAILRCQALGLLGNIELTFDSSTALQNATSKSYFSASHILKPPEFVRIGNDHNILNSEMRMPCNCPVCRSLGWMDALTVLPSNSIVIFTLFLHNIFAMESYFRVISNLANFASLQELVQWSENVIPNHKPNQTELVQTFKFIESCKEKGLQTSREEYRYYLNMTADISGQGGLIPMISEGDYDAEEDEYQSTLTKEELLEHYDDSDNSQTWEEYIRETFGSSEDATLREIDIERIAMFRNRLSAEIIKEERKGKLRKKTSLIKKGKNKGKVLGNRKELKFEDDSFKAKTRVKTKGRASFSKHKSKQKALLNKKDSKVNGKKVVKSRNRKKL